MADVRDTPPEGLPPAGALVRQLRAGLAASETEVTRLRGALAVARYLHATDAHNEADLLASEVALAASRAETQASQTDLLASGVVNQAMKLANAMLVASEIALRKGERRFRLLVEQAPNAIVMSSPDGLIEMVNAQTERLFGYTRPELLGARVEMLVPSAFGAAHSGPDAGVMADPSSRPVGASRPVFGLKKDGTEVEVEIGLSPIETDDGMMVLLTIVDISGRVRLEAQLRQSQKMQAFGQVAAGVAHDFNNLLQALGGSLECLLAAVADRPETVQWGNIALRATTRGKELTNRLLSFSRQQVLKARPVLVNALFSELQELIGHLFETNTRARTRLVIVSCPPDLAVMADFAQLEAALVNLAMNARDAMVLGGCLRISAYAADADPAIVPPGRYTVISVADTGEGMDAATLARACEPFFSTKGLNGTGLGLSMVQGFARQSGGEADITSKPGEGTTIDLWLPSSLSPDEAGVIAATGERGGRVLLVDDSEDSLLVVAAFLRMAGMDVTSVGSGDLALAVLARGQRFDAIVTDFAMPGMNGVELLALARDIDASMPGMIITGFSDPDLLPELADIKVLCKPFNRQELAETVQDLMGWRHSDDVGAPQPV